MLEGGVPQEATYQSRVPIGGGHVDSRDQGGHTRGSHTGVRVYGGFVALLCQDNKRGWTK